MAKPPIWYAGKPARAISLAVSASWAAGRTRGALAASTSFHVRRVADVWAIFISFAVRSLRSDEKRSLAGAVPRRLELQSACPTAALAVESQDWTRRCS